MTDLQSRPSGSPSEGYAGPKRSLVLAGGGMRVAYQAGVVRALLEVGLCFAHADGTSGGTINLAMLFSGLSPVEMCDRWRTLDVRDFVSFMPLKEYLKGPNLTAMGDADGIRNAIFPHLGIDVAKIRAARGMQGTFNVCNYTRKTNEAVPHDRLTLDLLVAGISLPIFMPAVAHDGMLYMDSVWIKDANLWEAVRRGAEELWLVWCIGNTGQYKPGLFDQYVHMIEISANGVLFEEFDRIRALNVRIARGDSPFGQAHPIRLHVIRPAYPLPLDPDLFFGNVTTATLIDMGYADAKHYLQNRNETGLSFEPEVTRMHDAKPGITFRETMAGPFALDVTDPEAGRRKGEQERTELALHATVHIHDIERFANDPDHSGVLSAHIDFPPFGRNIPASKGVFNLFTPADEPGLKLMVYEAGFEHDGTSYYLAGKKEVRDDPGFDLWEDTTTLYTRLHQGTDEAGPVVGAGILTLGAADLARLVSTMRATGTDAMGDKAKALGAFGRLFLSELWDTYGRHVQPQEV